MLTLNVEILTGAYRASLPDGSASEWPPHPERVFSALVQAWGDGGRDEGERAALEWLEALAPPEIEASPWDPLSERTAPTVFVPPNDAKGTALEALPERRRRQARTFRATAPADPHVRLRWPEAPTAPTRAALEALAARVAALGHSASLVRFAFDSAGTALEPSKLWRPAAEGDAPLRAAYPGRLTDLERWFAGQGPDAERPQSRRTVLYRAPGSAAPSPAVEGVFAGPSGWFVFEEAGGFRPDLLGFAHVARRVRDALMKLGPQPPAEIVSGHGPDDRPSTRPHVAIVPLANVGHEHASGDLLGFAVVLPRAVTPEDRRAVLESLARFVRFEDDTARATVHLFGESRWQVERSATPSRASLRPQRWCDEAQVWASATPVLLDRFPDGDDPTEEARLIAAACHNVGLPEPIEIEIHKHSAIKGAPSAYPARGRKRSNWTFPRGSKLIDRPRRHVVLRFEQKIAGPVLLGAGRYHGLGLLFPIEANR